MPRRGRFVRTRGDAFRWNSKKKKRTTNGEDAITFDRSSSSNRDAGVNNREQLLLRTRANDQLIADSQRRTIDGRARAMRFLRVLNRIILLQSLCING